MEVALVPVDESVLDELVAAAVADAAADDVTPPLSTDGSWSDARIDWLRAYHRDRRPGLDGPHREATWAVYADGAVVGAGRLATVEGPDTLEFGIWLTRAVRGLGVGGAVATLLLDRAATTGAATLVAETTSDNRAALRLLERLAFRAATPRPDGGVRATRHLADLRLD